MVLDLQLLALYVVTVVAMIALPGPVAVLVVGAGLSGGARRALATIAGTNAASLLLILLSVLVVRGLLALDETFFNLIKLLGALYLGYVGVGLLRDAPADTLAHARKGAGGFANGFLVAVSNPKDIVFFASFFPQFIAITPHAGSSLAVLTLLWIVLDFATLMLMFHLISRLLQPRVQRMLLRGSGGVLLVVAAVGGWAAGSALWVS